MIEIPEVYTISNQINDTVIGKKIAKVTANANPHTYAWYTGDPDKYNDKLAGKIITASYPGTKYTNGGYIEIECENVLLAISTPIKYHTPEMKLPDNYHLLIKFEDESHLSCTVQMWGAMYCHEIINGLVAGYIQFPNPLQHEFDIDYFKKLLKNSKDNITVKGLLTTEQHIPGLGNGVLHDILFNSAIHPKTKLAKLPDNDIEKLFHSIKSTLQAMTIYGGRDTEKDLFGKYGGYKTILSVKTKRNPCIACGSKIERETFLGGNIYYCPECQINNN